MAYPGDRQQPGDWSPHRPPQSPYGPAEDQAPHGDPAQDLPQDPPFNSPFGGSYDQPSYDQPSYGQSSYDQSPYGQSSYGQAPYAQDSYDQTPYGTEQPAPDGGQPGGFPGGYGGQDGYQRDPGAGQDAPGGYGRYGFEPADGAGGGAGGGDVPGRYGPGVGGAGVGGAGMDGEEPDGDGPRGGLGRRPLILGAAIAAGMVVIGGGTALALSSGGGGDPAPKAAPATTRAAAPTPTPSPTPTATATGKGVRLASRTTDPEPLTLKEVFGDEKFKGGGRSYLLTMRRSSHKCSSGTHGTKLHKALAKADCSQVLRATFSNGKLVGTIGVLNLKSEAAAKTAEKASHPKDAFVTPLPGASGATKKVGHGLALTTAEADGHYLILSWVQYPSGKKISKKDYGDVTSFVRYTTYGSNLRPALNYRSMEGKPA